MSDIKRIGMITLSNAAAAHMQQMPLLRAKGRRTGHGREGGSQPSKEARSSYSPTQPPSSRKPLYYETSAKSVIYRRALHASGEEETDYGLTMRERATLHSALPAGGSVANGRRKRQEVKKGEGRGGGRSGGLSCLSASIAYT